MPQVLGEYLQAADLDTYIPAVLRWMQKEGVLDFAEVEGAKLQDLHKELGLPFKSRHRLDICLDLYSQILVKRQIIIESMY